jgi:hypothetical protein
VIGEVRRVRARKGARSAADPANLPSDPDQAVASPVHDQWLLGEALAETFPASDPISPSNGNDSPPGG